MWQQIHAKEPRRLLSAETVAAVLANQAAFFVECERCLLHFEREHDTVQQFAP
jgi:hypothetical protein